MHNLVDMQLTHAKRPTNSTSKWDVSDLVDMQMQISHAKGPMHSREDKVYIVAIQNNVV